MEGGKTQGGGLDPVIKLKRSSGPNVPPPQDPLGVCARKTGIRTHGGRAVCLQQPFADGCCKQQSVQRQQQQAIKHINKSKEPSRPIDDPAMENVPKVFDVIDPSNPTGKVCWIHIQLAGT